MSTSAGPRRIALHLDGRSVPGVHAVVAGVARAAFERGWEVLGFRDGLEGMLRPERHPGDAMVALTPALVRDPACDQLLGGGSSTDPFRVQVATAQRQVEEVDRSDAILQRIRAAGIHGVVSVVDERGLAIARRLHRKGLQVACVPTSIEHDLEAVEPSLGFDSALSYATEMLDRAREAPRPAPCILVVEVLGERAGWLALRAGLAVLADAVLIPEIPYDLRKVAQRLRAGDDARPRGAVVVVAGGAAPAAASAGRAAPGRLDPLRASLAPLATGGEGPHAIFRSGDAGETVARELQRLTDRKALALALGDLARGAAATAADRELGVAYGAGAVRAIGRDEYGVVVSVGPRGPAAVPLPAVLNRPRTVPPRGGLVDAARAVGIALGD
jgi:6-phosphofructokinase 1